MPSTNFGISAKSHDALPILFGRRTGRQRIVQTALLTRKIIISKAKFEMRQTVRM
jgi:hypothetical protein